MAEAVQDVRVPVAPRSNGSGIWTIAWRNLWRNRRRTWLTTGGIAFAVWLLVFAQSMQEGTFEIMIDNGARLALGHVQIQHPEFQNDPRLEFTVRGSNVLVDRDTVHAQRVADLFQRR